MSNIPPAAKTKSLPKSSAASEAHEKLLTMTWTKLDALVAALFGVSPAARPLAIEAAKTAYRARMDVLADQAERFQMKGGGRLGDKLEGPNEALGDLVQRLRVHGDCDLNSVDESWFAAKITSRELESPLYATKGSGSTTREELVGFVDIACDLDIPNTLSVFCEPWIDDGQGEDQTLTDYLADPLTMGFGFGAEAAKSVRLPAASWFMGRNFPGLWIDVRPTDTPIGQLIRELKALREFADNADTRLLVVVDTIDDAKRAMLKHEDILIVTHQELEQL